MPEESLTARTVHGLKWSYLSTIVNVVLQIGVTAVLARLLTPSAFGLVAMAGVFLRFGQYFAQMGAGQAVVQKAELSAQDVRTAFTSSLLMGVVFCALFVALAPLAGMLFPHTRGVVMVARVMSLTFIFGGLTATTQGLLQRRFAFRTIALTEVGSYVLGYALVGLVLAFSGAGAWSLVAASLSAGALAAFVYTLICRHEIGFALNASSFKAIYSFGGRVSLVGFVEFIGSILDTLWVGHFFGARATGLYTRATNIATVPLYYFTTSLSRVLAPGYSRIQAEQQRLKSVYLSTITVMAAIVMPISWGLAASSHEVIVTLLGQRWSGAIPVLAILAVAAPFTILYHLGAIVCEATARLNERIGITGLRVAWLGALLAGLSRFGIIGVAFAFALSELLTHVAYLFAVRRLLAARVSDLMRAHSVGLVVGLAEAALMLTLHATLTILVGVPAPIVLLVQAVTGAIVLVFALAQARRGAVWREIGRRLGQAGFEPRGSGPTSWLMRRMTSLSKSRQR